MDRIVAIARLSLVRTLRERSNLFFVFAFPLLIVLLIGLSFGGQQTRRVLLVGPEGDALVASIEQAITADDAYEVRRSDDVDASADALGRGRADVLVVVPAGGAERLAAGEPVEVGVATRPEAVDARLSVEAALASVAQPHRARIVAQQLGATVGTGAMPVLAPLEVRGTSIDDAGETADDAEFGAFTPGAASILVLFVFLTTLTGATRIVESRELGVTRRILATSTSAEQLVLGEGLGRFVVALFQAAWIVVATLLLFRVEWGDPLAALVVISAFAAASAAGGLLLGALAKNVSQAGGLATTVALTLGALGGSMAPLEIFPDTMRRAAHLTPHAWANDAFVELTRRGGHLGDVLPEVLVLLGFAAVLWALASRRLRATITAGG